MMLAQASDWPFLISMDQSSRYAEERLIKHIDRAKELAAVRSPAGASTSTT